MKSIISPLPLPVRSDLPKEESLLVNFRVKIEKSEAGCGTCQIEGIEFQPGTFEIQESFLPFVSSIHIGLDSYFKQIIGGQTPQHTSKGRFWRWIRTWIENTRFRRRTHE
jgi:hypothetical protein